MRAAITCCASLAWRSKRSFASVSTLYRTIRKEAAESAAPTIKSNAGSSSLRHVAPSAMPSMAGERIPLEAFICAEYLRFKRRSMGDLPDLYREIPEEVSGHVSGVGISLRARRGLFISSYYFATAGPTDRGPGLEDQNRPVVIDVRAGRTGHDKAAQAREETVAV